MAEFDKAFSRQASKFVNTSAKTGTTKVLVFNSSFSGDDRSKGPLERSALHRLVVEAHEVKGSGDRKESVTLMGNIPAEKLPALLVLAEQALLDKIVYHQNIQFAMLPGVWKPRVSTKDENGNVEVYNVEINYDGTKNLPVIFKLTTLRAPVATDDTGRMNVKLRETVEGSKKEITFYLSAEDWYSQLVNAAETYELFRNRNSQLGTYDKALGFFKPTV